MTKLFWDVATSTLALEIDAVILLAALVVGWFPLLKYVPAIGPYVPVARLVSVLLMIAIAFLLGFRTSDERESMENLRATLAARDRDIAIASKSEADAQRRASEIEAAANAQRQSDADYIASLVPSDACAFDPDVGGVRIGSGNAGIASPKPPAGR